MTKPGNEDFKNSTKFRISDNNYIDNDVKVRNHCHTVAEYRGSVHKDCNINFKLNHKIPVVFHALKSYDSHLIMQELGKFNPKINIIPNGLKIYMSFTINRESPAEKLLTKNMNMFLMFEINLIWKNESLSRQVLSLTDVCEKFRSNSLKNYGLCLSNYLITPGLSWNAILKIAKLNLNLLLTCIYSLRKIQEVEFLIFLINIAKPAINI